MRSRRVVSAVVSASVAAIGIAGCAAPTPAPTPAVAPVVENVDDLRGATVAVPVNSTLIVITDWSDVDRYTAAIADPAIAEFVPGADTGHEAFSPSFKPKRVGHTAVTLSRKDNENQAVEFTLDITSAPPG